MARTGCCLGTVFMVVAFGVLFAIVIFPVLPGAENNAFLTDMLEPLFCRSGETLTQDTLVQRDLRGTVSSPQYYCTNESGEQRDVTDTATIYGVVGFVVPFLAGLFLTMIGSVSAVRKTVTSAIDLSQTAPGEPGLLRVGGVPIRVHPVEDITPPVSSTVAEKLRELDELRVSELISDDEYNRLRTQILDEGF